MGKKLDVVALACHPSYCEKHKMGGLVFRLARAKLPGAKGAGGVARAVGHLSSKSEALSSNSSTSKKERSQNQVLGAKEEALHV
jgi:hypothetical protein